MRRELQPCVKAADGTTMPFVDCCYPPPLARTTKRSTRSLLPHSAKALGNVGPRFRSLPCNNAYPNIKNVSIMDHGQQGAGHGSPVR